MRSTQVFQSHGAYFDPNDPNNACTSPPGALGHGIEPTLVTATSSHCCDLGITPGADREGSLRAASGCARCDPIHLGLSEPAVNIDGALEDLLARRPGCISRRASVAELLDKELKPGNEPHVTPPLSPRAGRVANVPGRLSRHVCTALLCAA
jgi:hypothetical protein